MGKVYRHLSLTERDRITELKSDGMSLRKIAEELGAISEHPVKGTQKERHAFIQGLSVAQGS